MIISLIWLTVCDLSDMYILTQDTIKKILYNFAGIYLKAWEIMFYL